MLRTVLCDDELPALELLSDFLRSTGGVEIVASCQSIEQALAVINAGGVDLAVFDVEMPELSGVTAYQRITAVPKPLVVFATAHPEYAVEAFGVDAIDYLLKPLDQERVNRAVEKAVRLHGLIKEHDREGNDDPGADPDEAGGYLRVRDAGRFHFIPYHEVLWIEAAGDYSLVHRLDRESAIRTPIKELAAQLPADLFVRVHRSAIVAVDRVAEIKMLPKGDAQIVLAGGAQVRGSRSFRAEIEAIIKRT